MSYPTTRLLYKKYKEFGESSLQPQYSNCGPQGIKSSYRIYRASCWLKRLHPTWGTPFILLQLKEHYPKVKMPSVRMLQRWFLVKGYNKPRQKKRTANRQSKSST